MISSACSNGASAWTSAARRCVAFVGVVALSVACPPSPRGRDATPQAEAPEPYEVSESIYDGGWKNGWHDSGTAVRELSERAPAKVRFNVSWEWVLNRPAIEGGADGKFGGVVFRVQEPPGEGEFLEVELASSRGPVARAVKLKPDHRTLIDGGWTQVILPMDELDPQGAAFDRIVFRPFRPFGTDWVLFDKIALAKATAALNASTLVGKRVQTHLQCDAPALKISPLIYGIAGAEAGWERLGATGRRWGGNPASRYNWEANCDNRAADWFFENASSAPYTQFLTENAAHAVASALTIPMLGWVAKDGTSYSFPVSVFGAQAKTDPWKGDAGNGIGTSGAPIAPGAPTRTSVPAPPEWAHRWVEAIRAEDAKTGKRGVNEYILDNEPALWSVTHRDVHPDPVGFDELLDRTVRYGRAIREADPDAVIAGPAEWGWSGYFYSAKDLVTRYADRAAHGGLPLIEWYLRKLRDYERQTGTRVLDVLDLHYYPQENNVYGGGGTDRETQLLRLRSTRSLWDDGYVDESWIKDVVRLLPRMREWVDRNYPGLGLSIGEWNFGGERDITGALATAETLGRFAQFGVTSAFYWLAPPAGSASAFGFLAYRNFDAKGGRFLDWYIPTTRAERASFFASRDEDRKHLVVVALNLAPDVPVIADLDVSSCGVVGSYQTYVYTRDAPGFAVHGPAETGPLERLLPPWSITVFDVHLRGGADGSAE